MKEGNGTVMFAISNQCFYNRTEGQEQWVLVNRMGFGMVYEQKIQFDMGHLKKEQHQSKNNKTFFTGCLYSRIL